MIEYIIAKEDLDEWHISERCVVSLFDSKVK